MKSTKVERAIGIILTKQTNIAKHVEGLNPEEKRRVLMYVANESASSGFDHVMLESIKLLGFRDEEALIFATAALGGHRPLMVPRIVKKFCRNTAIARCELGSAARANLGMADQLRGDESQWIDGAVQCVELMGEKIKPNAKGVSWNNDATNLTLFILWVLEEAYAQERVRNKELYETTLQQLRKLVPSESDWKWLQDNKRRMGGPRKHQ